MLNHTYTSIKNANLVDSGNTQHIASQPSVLLKSNFLGEFRTELEKKKVLSNLGIVTDLLLEWEYIKGDVGKNQALMDELDVRTSYVSLLDNFEKTLADGLHAVEEIIKGEQDVETEQDNRISILETTSQNLVDEVNQLKTYLQDTIEVDVNKIKEDLASITEKVNNITELIKVSSKAGNALMLVGAEQLQEGETPGLYVPDLSGDVNTAKGNIETLQANVRSILDTYVTKAELGGGDFDFVNQSEYDEYTQKTDTSIADIKSELTHTVKTGEDGHVDTLYVNTISKNNDDANIKVTDSFEVDSGIPLDVRFVKKNVEELCSIPAKVCYPGMGVIVQEANALYILRNPGEGVKITQEYVQDIYNWKCPEDLVTTALSREEYEALESVNPHVFYYIYEDEITRTTEPKREDYASDEEFSAVWQQWVDSLKTLSQEYMSASWGVDMENRLGKKASQQSLNLISEELSKIKGDIEGPSLASLTQDIQALQQEDTKLKGEISEIIHRTEEGEAGRLVTVETEVANIKNDLPNYVTKEELSDSENDFIFVNKDDYESDKTEFQTSLASKITTDVVEANTINTTTINVSNKPIVSSDNGLSYDGKQLAHTDDLPNLQVLPQTEYDQLESVDENTYYYTYDNEEFLVTKTELNSTLAPLRSQLNNLGSQLDQTVTLETYNTLVARVAALEEFIKSLQNPEEV